MTLDEAINSKKETPEQNQKRFEEWMNRRRIIMSDKCEECAFIKTAGNKHPCKPCVTGEHNNFKRQIEPLQQEQRD